MYSTTIQDNLGSKMLDDRCSFPDKNIFPLPPCPDQLWVTYGGDSLEANPSSIKVKKARTFSQQSLRLCI